jgi:hypothetical protein
MKIKLNIIWFIILLMVNCWSPLVDVSECLSATEPMGFWYGVWHGMIMVPAFFASLFIDGIGIYAINNNGAWYNFGYIGGIVFLLQGIVFILRTIGIVSNNNLK